MYLSLCVSVWSMCHLMHMEVRGQPVRVASPVCVPENTFRASDLAAQSSSSWPYSSFPAHPPEPGSGSPGTVWLGWPQTQRNPPPSASPPRRGSKGVGSYTYTCKGGLNYFFLYVWVGRVQMHSRLNLGGIHHLSLSQSSPSLLRGPPPDFSPALRVHQGPSGGDQTQVLSYQLRPLNDLFKK